MTILPGKFLTLLTALFTTFNLYCQSPNWDWAKQQSAGGSSSGQLICTDPYGNLLVSGSFESPSLTLGTVTVSDSGGHNTFLAKYDTLGNVIWARNVGGIISAITIDSTGIYAGGYFSTDSIVVDGITLINPYPGSANRRLLLVRFDHNGNVLWMKTHQGNASGYVNDIKISGQGLYFCGVINTYTMQLDGITLTSNGASDILLAHLDNDGNIYWAVNAGGSMFEDANELVVLDSQIVVACSYYSYDMVFAGLPVLVAGDFDAGLFSFDLNGVPLWSRQFGSADYDYIDQLVVHDSTLYVSGNFNSPSLNIDGVVLSNFSSGYDVWLAKLSPDGSVLWAKSFGGYLSEGVSEMQVDSTGVYLGGSYSSVLLMGGVSYPSYGATDLYVTKFDLSGNFVWFKKAGNTYSENTNSITRYKGSTYLTGSFNSSTVNFYPVNLTNPDSPDQRLFIAKIGNTFPAVSVEEMENAEIINAYPNPFQNTCVISLPYNFTNAVLNVKDVSGRVITEKFLNGETSLILDSFFEPGFYFVEILNEGKAYNCKIIRQ
jgi:hypothetical protein